MKGKTSTKRLFSLGSAGIAHFLAPLLIVVAIGLVGAYMVVGSHAASLKHASSAASHKSTTKATKSAKGYLVVYGEQGRYNSVKISSSGSSKSVVCGGNLTAHAADNSVVKHIPAPKKDGATQRLKLHCTAIGGDAQYNVWFGKNNKFTENPLAVDVDAHTCTLVHHDPAQMHKVVAGDNGSCANDQDTPVVLPVTMRVLPALTASKKGITGYVELAAPGTNVMKTECAGQVTVTYTNGGKSASYANPLKYARPKGVSNGYCVAKLGAGIKFTSGTYTVSANFGGSKYFQATNASATITVPKK